MATQTSIDKLLPEVTQYLDRVLGAHTQINAAADSKKTSRLPVYLDRGYRFYDGSIQGQPLTFACPMEPDNLSPVRMKKDAAAISNILGYPVVFVMERLPSHQRTRLIQQKVAFIIPGRQLHIPNLLISLTDTEEKIRLPKAQKLRPASQVLLLYHLVKERLDTFNFQTIAEKIGYSAMTVKRAAEELQAYNLARREGKSEKFLRFPAFGRELWDMACPFLASPMRVSYFIKALPTDTVLKKAGILALSDYTELAPGARPAYALFMGTKDIFERKLPPFEVDYFVGDVEIELWYYDPAILSSTVSVDPLSLYLSLPSYGLDERTALAKEELINRHVW